MLIILKREISHHLNHWAIMSEDEDKKICFISFVSRDDKPLYIQAFGLEDEEAATGTKENGEGMNKLLKYNFLSHMALDIIASPTSIGIREQQQDGDIKSGAVLLVIQDDVTVYGYESNTGLKILIGFDNQTSGINEPHQESHFNLKRLFNEVHKIYIKTVCNPFLEVDGNENELQTTTFDKRIKRIAANWNQ